MYEVSGETAMQTVLAIEPGDSIRRVAQRLQTPYETVRQTVNQLEDAGYLTYDDGLYLTDDTIRTPLRDLLAASAHISPPTIDEAYILPHFGDWPFAFTRIDAAYVWTHGGYQVGRSPDDYPLFLAVQEPDVADWRAFFDDFGLPTSLERQPRESIESPLQIVLEPRPTVAPERVEGYPVISRAETIEYMQENYTHFQSGLAMLNRMYEDLNLDVDYRDSERAAP
jgi:hypothetical protein